jgi:hypothetical protein
MNGIATWLDKVDKGIFRWFRTTLFSDFLESNAGLFGDLYAWIPVFVFLIVVLYLSRPNSAVFSLFFGLAAFVLSFQASMLLANFLFQPSPVKMEYILRGMHLPAYGRAYAFGMPDWAVAALVATFHFSKLRVKAFGGPNLSWGWIGIGIFCVLRIYAGFTYPLGALVGILVGTLVAWLMFKLARSVEMLSPSLPQDDRDQTEKKD